MSRPQLVLLHGLPLDHTMWQAQAQLFPDSTVAPRLYDLGASLSDWATGVLGLVGDGPLVVVGNSVGGSCALEMARQAPDRIAGLVLVGAGPRHRPDDEARRRYVRLIEQSGPAGIWPVMLPCFSSSADPAIIEATRMIAMKQPAADLARGTNVFHSRADATDVATKWTKPLLLIGGDQDPLATVAKLEALAASLPNAQVEIVRNCGHYVSLERPTEFDTILSGFLQGVFA